MAHHHHHGEGHTACVRLVPIFNHLSDEQMDLIAASAYTRKVSKNELLFRVGEKDDMLYIISSGRIRIYQLNESGREQTIRILNPGDFTGEVAIFQSDRRHHSYAVAALDTTVCMIRKADLDNHLDNYPEITRRILADVTQRLQVSEKQTTQVGIENVASRIVAFLADYVVDENNHTFVDLPMTRKDLASYLGTTPETISRKFSALEEQDLIRQHAKNRIEIMDLDELLFSVE